MRSTTVFTLLGMLLLGAIIGMFVWWYQVRSRTVPLIFAPTQALEATWVNYVKYNLEPGTYRTIDTQRNNITTSEGESYTMLRAVWMSDKATFDTSWKWTKDNLQHKNGDHLFAWLFGKQPNGSYGVLTSQGGNTTASDGDEDIALALVFGYSRWQDPAYLTEAKQILTDVWNNDVVIVNGTPYLAADNLEKNSTGTNIAIDPSYLAPANYRVFTRVDTTHPWEQLASSSYDVLEKSIDQPLDKQKSAGIPPDWIMMNKVTGAIQAPSGVSTTTTTNFGFDALRVPYRLALDAQWFNDPRDTQLLSKMSFLRYTWQSASAIGTTYAHDGSPVDPNQTDAMYGGAIGYFISQDPTGAAQIYNTKLASLYNPDINDWKTRLPYYDDNWTWFGIALYNHLLPNLSAELPVAAYQQ